MQMPTIIDHPTHGQLISLQELAEGFGQSHPNQLNLFRDPERVKVKGRSYVVLNDVIAAVRLDWFSGGGKWPTSEFQAFIREFRDAPRPSVWQAHDESHSWLIEGRECSAVIVPLPPNQPDGNYALNLTVQGDSDWYAEWVNKEMNHRPRYYFELDTAKSEAVAWLKRNSQFVE
jgi:hypothetical protein